MSALLFGVSPLDWVTYVAVAAGLGGDGAARELPARRAARPASIRLIALQVRSVSRVLRSCACADVLTSACHVLTWHVATWSRD